MTFRWNHIFAGALLAMILAACKPTVPSQYISPDDMEDVLYDYYLSQSMAEFDGRDGNMNYNKRLYFLAVLKKHGLTEAEFDSSLVYYYRRADYLRKIYNRLQERMGDEAVGTAVSSVRRRYVAGGDTADIWSEKKSFMLTPAIPYNRMDFEIKADTSFRKGDTYMMTFDANFLYQSGTKDATVYVAVRYANDSVAQFNQNVGISGLTQVRVRPNDNDMVRDIRGYVYLDRGRDESSTLKLMFIDNVQFLRMRKPKEVEKSAQAKTDSIHRADSIRKAAPDTAKPLRNVPPLPPRAMGEGRLQHPKSR